MLARNGVGVTSPVVSDGFANYTPGVSERRGGVTRYQSSDIKNATAQVSSSQTVVGTKQYDAFGNLTSSSGSWNGPFSYGGAFGYQTETDTGYQLLGHRYYDPTTGRFLTRDPIGDGRNWYTYCANNPVSYFDAEGLKKRMIIIVGDCGGGIYGPASDVAIWQFRRAFYKKMVRMFGEEYDVVQIDYCTVQQALNYLNDPTVDAVVFYGHGRFGAILLDDGALDIKALGKVRRKKRLDFIWVACCYSIADNTFFNALLDIAVVVLGYSGSTLEPLEMDFRKRPALQSPTLPQSKSPTGKKKGKKLSSLSPL